MAKVEKWLPVPLPDNFYTDDSLPFSEQDLVNYLKENSESAGTKSNFKLAGVPGLKPVLEVGEGPHRGAHDVEGSRFFVADTHLYEWLADGSVEQRMVIPGRSRVQMAHNQIASGYEIGIANGQAGYIWNTVSKTGQKITDPSFSGGKALTFIDQMFVWVEVQGRRFQPSDIADGLTYTALEEQEAEYDPDKLQTVVAAHQKLYACGKDTLQSYTSTGDPEELFADDKAGLDVGFASPHCVAVLDNTLLWLDDKGVFRRLNGGIAQRISTHALEKQWAQYDRSKCFVMTWEDRGHAVVYLTFPDGYTFGYDCATQRWHRRKSFNMERWRLNTLVKWGQQWYGGAYNSGVLYALDWDYPLEGCDPLEAEGISGVLDNNGNRLQVDGYKLVMDTGSPTVECVHVEPEDFTVYVAAFGDTAAGNPGNVIFSGPLEGPRVEESPDHDNTVDARAGVAQLGNKIWFTGPLASTDLFEATLPDLATWTLRTLAHSGVNALHSNGTNKLVTVKNSGTNSVNVGYSSDGATWASVNVPGIYMGMVSKHTLTYGGGYFGFVGFDDSNTPTEGTVAFSANGSSGWTVYTIDAGADPFCSLVYTGTAWIAGRGNGELWRSTDRATWTKVSDAGEIFNSDFPAKYSASDGAGKVLAGGWDGVFGNASTFGISTDHGLTWTDVSATYTGNKLSAHIAYLNGYFYVGSFRTASGTWEAFDLTDGPGYDTASGRFDGLIEYTP